MSEKLLSKPLQGLPTHEHHHHCAHGHEHTYRLRNKLVNKIRNQKAKMILASTLRLGGLILCPGDDIAAATLAALHYDEKHHIEQAILPQNAIIEKEIVTFIGKKRLRKIIPSLP